MSDEQIIQKINNTLDIIRPNIQMSGADIQFMCFKGGIISLKLTGLCQYSPSLFDTIKSGVEEKLKEHIPDIYEVVAISS
jgi:Fe-S cluster biogenesis protein NfuA